MIDLTHPPPPPHTHTHNKIRAGIVLAAKRRLKIGLMSPPQKRIRIVITTK